MQQDLEKLDNPGVSKFKGTLEVLVVPKGNEEVVPLPPKPVVPEVKPKFVALGAEVDELKFNAVEADVFVLKLIGVGADVVDPKFKLHCVVFVLKPNPGAEVVVPKFNDGGIVVGVPNKFVVCFAVLASPAPLPKVTPDEAFAEKYLLNL